MIMLQSTDNALGALIRNGLLTQMQIYHFAGKLDGQTWGRELMRSVWQVITARGLLLSDIRVVKGGRFEIGLVFGSCIA